MTISTFRAMGTTVEVHGREQGIRRSERVFASYEGRFSRFLPDSELSQINRSASSPSGGTQKVSAAMNDLLTLASDLKRRTEGLVDIGVGRAVSDWGYKESYENLDPPQSPPSAPSSIGWAIEDGCVYLEPGTQIDLGGIAKGWTADRVVETGLAEMVSAGGDLRSSDPSLVVEIMDEHERVSAEVHVGEGALATSSQCSRRWMVGSLSANHIIDPRTSRPVISPVRSASVVAATAAEAEAGAKAVLVKGQDGLAWADQQDWIHRALVVWDDGSVYANGGGTL
jgi:thiamine biosynthesis lipoprotein